MMGLLDVSLALNIILAVLWSNQCPVLLCLGGYLVILEDEPSYMFSRLVHCHLSALCIKQ